MRAAVLAALALVLAACGHQGSSISPAIQAKAQHRAERFCADPELVGEALDAKAYLDCVDHYAAVFARNMQRNADR
jgi:hypothetical protein